VTDIRDSPDVRDEPDLRDSPGTVAARRRPTGRRLRLTAALLTVLVLVVGVTAAQQRWDAAAGRDLAAALGELDRAEGELRSARYAGRAVLAGSAERVADDTVRRDLAGLLVALPRTVAASEAPRAARTAQARELAPAVVERTRLLTAATATVRQAQAEWELAEATARHTAALSALDGAVQEASAVLAASEGRVLDDAPRQVLAAAVEAATALRGLPAPADVAALDAGTVQVGAQVQAVADARAAVTAAEAAWQVEQERRAAAAAEAARRQQATSGAGKGTATRPSGAAAGSSGSSSPGTSAPSSPAAPSTPWAWGDPLPPGWTVVVETEGGGWCGDEFGNVWDC
jgi:hypothetical protein